MVQSNANNALQTNLFQTSLKNASVMKDILWKILKIASLSLKKKKKARQVLPILVWTMEIPWTIVSFLWMAASLW